MESESVGICRSVEVDLDTGYGIHYPVRHGQVENWVGC